MTRIFCSYNRGDGVMVQQLHDGLEREGYIVFWDQENHYGERWTDQVMDWLRGADVVVLVVSPHSVGSYSVQSEIQIALVDLERKVIPLQIAPKSEILKQQRIGLWLLIRLIQRADAWPPRDALEELLKALRREGFYPTAAPVKSTTADQSDPVEPDEPDMGLSLTPSLPKPPPPASGTRARIIIELPGNFDEFDAREREGFVRLLASLSKVSPQLVKVLAVEQGSIRVTLELPESTARWLIKAQEHNDEVAQRLSIRAIRSFTVLAAPPPLARLRTWLGALSAPVRLAGAGALLVLLMLALTLARFLSLQLPQSLALCADLSLTAGGCPVGTPTALFGGEIRDVTLSGPQTEVPVLLAPRDGRLLEPETLVRWTTVPSAASYTVSLSRDGALIWSGTITGTGTLAYPPMGAPPLERGATYLFGVRTAEGRSENASGISFSVLSLDEVQTVRVAEERIRAQGLDDAIITLLVANLYAQEQLYGEALNLLEPMADTPTQPAIELLRGNIYATVGLPELALAAYERALNLGVGDAQVSRLIQERVDELRAQLGR